MMIDKRLIGTVGESKRYIAGNVALQGCSLAAIRSLEALEKKLHARGLRPKIITGHTGWTDDMDFAFAHREKVCNAFVRQKPHDPEAPYDAYDESGDTEERARSVRLKKA